MVMVMASVVTAPCFIVAFRRTEWIPSSSFTLSVFSSASSFGRCVTR
jgi:hypothetical protein